MLRLLLVTAAAAATAGSFSSCGGAPAGLSEAAVRGKEVFLTHASPTCGTCHVLADAGTRGALGPNLDASQFARDRILKAVVQGVGNMPSHRSHLTEQQMEDVATYVAEVAGK